MKALYTSASALETADPKTDGCYRKWYLEKVAALPQPPKASSTFGDVLHGVAERYLLADENGMANGKPVELYPDGWEYPHNRFTGERSKESVSLEEQSLIKLLISAAISEGILTRVPGRQIEKAIRYSPMTDVVVKGFIDLLEPSAIRDHKTTKDMKWAKSVKRGAKESLYSNVQLMLYAHWYYTYGGYEDKSKPLSLSHQYYVKDPQKPRVEKREVSVTWPEVFTFFSERIAPVMEMMLIYRECAKYSDIPLPENVEASCKKYGGCPFAKICTEQESVNEYTKRINQELTGVSTTDYAKIEQEIGGTTMNTESPMQKKIREMREKQTANLSASKVTTAPAPEPVAEPSAPATVLSAAEKPKAPWYDPSCKACAGNDILGINSQGTAACKICDILSKKAGKKNSNEYKWKVKEGVLEVSDGETVVQELKTAEPATVKEVVVSPSLAPAVEPKSVEPKAATPAVEPKSVEPKSEVSEVVIEEGKERGAFEGLDIESERGYFTILIGCAYTESRIKGGGRLGSKNCRVTGEEMLIIVESEMSRLLGAVKWKSMSIFEKKDAVTAMAVQIAEALGESVLTISRLPKGSLLESVVMGISPYGNVIRAMVE